MLVMVWLADGHWKSAIDAARTFSSQDATYCLVHVAADDLGEVTRGAFAGLLGRRYAVGDGVDVDVSAASMDLLTAARERLGNADAELLSLHGRIEREVVTAADKADLLIVVRDGDLHRLGPRSLGPTTRFVVDHAPCPVLLVWAGEAPGVATIPPPPPPGHQPPPPPPGHEPPPHDEPHHRDI